MHQQRSMKQITDLDTAVSFVVRRVEEQAGESGQLLNEEQLLLLKNLPPPDGGPHLATEFGPPGLVPRNINLERICALTKAAYQHDSQLNPETPTWEFAFAVLMLNQHPMSGLLQFAGMKRIRPRWDRLRLTIAALIPMIAALLIAFNMDKGLVRPVGIGVACIAIIVFLFFGSKRVEKHRLNEEIEKYRVGL